MTTSALSIKGFQDLLDRWGSDLDTWPHPDRLAAQALLAASNEARERLESARGLDRALGDTPKAPADLVNRILAASGASGKKS